MTALALRDDQDYWDKNQLAVLHQTGIGPEVSEGELRSFLHECQQRKLDPFTRQIYLIGRYDKRAGRKVYRSQTGIDGFRLIARRAADRAGETIEYEDTIWFDADGGRHEVWLSDEAPFACKVVALRGGKRFPAIARYSSYVQVGDNGRPGALWQKMPDNQIEKCCEAKALRKAFPEELGGIYTDDEMAQADNPQTIQATVIRDEDGQPPWADQAIEDATALKSEHAAAKLWRETATRARAGEISDKDAGTIQDLINARVADLRQKAYSDAMSLLSENEAWRPKIEELASGEDARDALNELGALIADGTIDARRGQRISRAIVARFPQATDTDPEVAA